MANWKSQAEGELRRLAATGTPFSADDLYQVLDHPDPEHMPNARNNMIGQLFREARASGLIKPVGVEQSKQPHRKGGMIRIWQGKKMRLIPRPRHG